MFSLDCLWCLLVCVTFTYLCAIHAHLVVYFYIMSVLGVALVRLRRCLSL